MPIKVFLTVTEGPSKGTARDFSSGKMTVGRGKVDLILFDKKVSNQHCRFEIDGNDLWLEDLTSTNGTFLGSKRVAHRMQLQNLDEVIVGTSKINVAIVEQMADFKKANTPVKAPTEERPAPSSEEISVDMDEASEVEGTEAKISPPEPTQTIDNTAPLPDGPGFYRETGVHRIENLIKDEMATFSQWDHPAVSDPNDNVNAIPRVKVQLLQRSGEGKIEFTCTKPITTIGRKNVDVKLADLDSSRLHAQIEIVASTRVFAKDLASTNGTFVNGKRITTQELSSGDMIQIGQTVLEVQIEGASS